MTKLDMVIKELEEKELFSYANIIRGLRTNQIKALAEEGEEIKYKHIHGSETEYTLTWEDIDGYYKIRRFGCG